MSFPNLMFSTPTFVPPASAGTYTVPASAPATDPQASANGPVDEALGIKHRTTSGALFRCRINDQQDVNRLLCCQCSGENTHVSEATPLNSRSSGASLPRTGILDLSIEGLDLPLCADAKCVQRDSPLDIKRHPENAELTQLAQRSVVKCAYDVSEGSECGEWLLLSELPRHHHGTHSVTMPEPQNSSAAISASLSFGRSLLAPNQPSPAASVPPGAFGVDVHHKDRLPLFEPAQSSALSRGVEGNKEGIRVLGSGFGMSSGIQSPRQDRPSLFGSPNVAGVELSKDIEGNKKGIDELTKQVAALVKENSQLTTLVARLSAEVADLGVRIQNIHTTRQSNPDNTGILLWKIPDFKNEIAAARLHSDLGSFYSDFFCARSGHLLRARIYPNGDGLGKKTHVSVFLTIYKSKNDRNLEWPFKEKVTMSVVDSEGQVLCQDHFRPDPGSSSFQKPVRDHNIASGIPRFLLQEGIENFLVDGALLLKIAVGEKPDIAQFSVSSNPTSQGRLYPKLN